MCDSVDLMLTLQNSDGGFSSFEPIRGYRWLEWLNPAEVFGTVFLPICLPVLLNILRSGGIMTEYSYPECTTSVITSLSMFRKHFPDYRVHDIK
jgi:lanosterol synthase